jgi:Mce-associated membrane protein
MQVATVNDLAPDVDTVDVESSPAEAVDAESGPAESAEAVKARSVVRHAPVVFLVAGTIALAVLGGWSGYRLQQAHQAQAAQAQFVAGAKQGAVNLTTIDWQHADADVKRILDGATGQFSDEFSARSKPFAEVVKQAKSSSVGTVTEAALESQDGDSAQVMVAMAVKTSTNGAPDTEPRAWRMRIAVQKLGGEIKVSNVEFVP